MINGYHLRNPDLLVFCFSNIIWQVSAAATVSSPGGDAQWTAQCSSLS